MTYRRTGNLFTPTRNIWVPRILAPPMCEISPARIGGIAAARRRSSAIVYDFEENFETPTTGYDNAGWTTYGSADPAYSTAPAPLQGSQSLYSATGALRGAYRSNSLTGEIWYYWQMYCITGVVNDYQFYGDAAETSIRMRFVDGKPYLYAAGALAGTTNTLPVDTKTHFWIWYKPGGGGTAEGKLWWSTDGTKTTSQDATHGYAAVTGATGTTDTTRPWWVSRSTYAVIWDRIIINSAEIGDNP